MADPGTVIGIVNLAGQLLQGLKSLHTFFGDIKDAPTDIQKLTQELGSTEAVLDKTLDQLSTFNPENSITLLETAVQNCAASVTKLEDLTRPLQVKGQDTQAKRIWKQIATAFKKEDFQKHISMLHGARLNIIAAQGAWAIDLHHSHATKTNELHQSIKTLRSTEVIDSAAISNKLEDFSKTLEEFPSFMRPMVQAAVHSAMETHMQNMKSLSSCQQEPNDSCNTMEVEESGKLGGKRRSVECSAQTHYHSRTMKDYHFWFGKICIDTSKRDVSYESSDHGWSSRRRKFLWRATILVMPAPWILRKGTLVALEYITRETRKTSFQINIEPIRIIPHDSPVFRACREGDFNAVRTLIEGGQASPHDRDDIGWTLLDEALRGISLESRKPTGARDTENLIDYLISISMDLSETFIFRFTSFLFQYHSRFNHLRNPTINTEHILHCMNRLICAPNRDLLDFGLILYRISSLSCFDGRYSQFLLHLYSQDDTIDLDKMFSDPRSYVWVVFTYNHYNKQPTCEELLNPALLRVEIGKFLGKKSIVLKRLFLAETGLMQSCFLEKTIMSGSFFIHQSTNALLEKDRQGARTLVEAFLIHKLTLLLKREHCPRGALGRSNQFPDLDWLKFYSPTKLARDLGVLELWRKALVQSGHDASDIIDESLYAGIIDLFDGLSYQYSEWGKEEEGYEDEDDNANDGGQKPGLVKKAAKLALTVVSSIV